MLESSSTHKFQQCIALSTALHASQVSSRLHRNTCPLLGPAFPQPHELDVASIRPYTDNLTLAIEDAFAGRGNPDWPVSNTTTSFSITLWTASSNDSLFEYHYESPEIRGHGHDVLNNDTVYRLGSISKLFPVYAWLATLGEAHLDEPITDFIPELAEIDRERAADPASNYVDNIQWSDVTPRALAAQLGDIPRDYGLGDFAGDGPDDSMLAIIGLPPREDVNAPLCVPFIAGQNTECSREEFFQAIRSWHPVAHPYSTPVYSNPAFGILAWALEAIIDDGRSFTEILQDNVVSALGLKRTFLNISPDTNLTNAMIPYNSTYADWFLTGSFDNPAGNYYSSVSDMNAFGRSILRSSLIPRRLTNRWLKPVSFTADPMQAVGMPWEIYRYEVPVSKDSQATRLVDGYSKAGDVGLYSTMMMLLPDYNAGFTVFTAGDDTTPLQRVYLTEIVRDHFIPALEDLAAKEAERLYGGTYVDVRTNSSITIELNAGKFGLGIEEWKSRGVDMRADDQGFKALMGTEQPGRMDLRLQPMGVSDDAARRVAFRIVPNIDFGLDGTMWSCFSWVSVDGRTYGGIGVDEVVFELDGGGRARSVDLRGFRTVLTRLEDS